MPEAFARGLLQPGPGILAAASWAGLPAGVAALYRLRWGKVLLGVQASVVALLTMALLPMFLTSVTVHAMTFGVWLSPPVLPSESNSGAGGIELGYAMDALGLTVMAAVSCLVILMLVTTGGGGGECSPVADAPGLPKPPGRLPADTFAGRSGSDSAGATRRTLSAGPFTGTAGFLLLLLVYEAALQFTLAAQLLVQVACWQLMSVCCFLGSRRASGVSPMDHPGTDRRLIPADRSRRPFVYRLVGDGMLWLGLALAAVTFPSDDVLLGNVRPAHLSAAVDVEFIAGVILVLGVLVRSFAGLFVQPRDKGGAVSRFVLMDWWIVTPIAFLFLLRCRPLFDASAAVWNLLLLSGMLVAVTTAGRAVRQEFGRAESERNTGSAYPAVVLLPVFLGMMLTGVGTGHPQGAQGAVLLFASTVLFVPVLMLLVPVLTARPDGAGQSRMGNTVFFVAMCAVVLGLTGQAHVISSCFAPLEANAADAQAPPARWVLGFSGAGLIAAQGMTGFTLLCWCRFRWFHRPSQAAPAETERTETAGTAETGTAETEPGVVSKQSRAVSAQSGLAEADSVETGRPYDRFQPGAACGTASRAFPVVLAVLVSVLIAGYVMPGAWDREYGEFLLHSRELPTLDGFIVVLTALVGAMGGTLGWMKAESEIRTTEEKPHAAATPPLSHASVPITITVRPLTAAGQVCRWLERFVLGQLRGVWARLPHVLADTGDSLQRGTLRFLVLWLFLVTAVLLGVVVGMGM